MKNIFGAQLIYSDSGLDPVTVPASFRQQVSEESRREWEGRISTDRQEDSVSREMGCSQTSALLGREREVRGENKTRYTFCLNPQTQKLSVFGNGTQCANRAEYRRPSSSRCVLVAPRSSSITTATEAQQLCERHSRRFESSQGNTGWMWAGKIAGSSNVTRILPKGTILFGVGLYQLLDSFKYHREPKLQSGGVRVSLWKENWGQSADTNIPHQEPTIEPKHCLNSWQNLDWLVRPVILL